jgi:DNA-directed RNA polymerase beta' subunit
MDYEFFTLFTERIESSESGERAELIEKRNLLLKITQDIDKQLELRLAETKEMLEEILENESLEEAVVKNINGIDQLFLQVASSEMDAARQNKDSDREEKLGNLLQILQRFSPPPELEVVEALLSVADEEEKFDEVIRSLDENMLTRVVDYLTSIISRFDEQEETTPSEEQERVKETQDKLKEVFNTLLRKSMDLKMKGS